MNKIYRPLILIAVVSLLAGSANLHAGNRDRSGQAGAQHLLIDPWARSNGWGNAGVADTRGLESVYANVAGIAFMNRTEFGFSRTQYLAGSGAGIGINSFGIVQSLARRDKETGVKIRDFGVLGISVFTMGFGDIPMTTVTQPEGIGTFSPSLMYIGIHYAKSFNNFIHGGVTGKIITENISDMSATGFALDAGVQYVSGPFENFRIGVTLKNIGLPMRYSGDGLSLRGVVSTTDHELTLEPRSAEAEMPALLTIGVSYDFLMWGRKYQSMSREERVDEGLTRNEADHRITLAASFTANSYSRDNFVLGIEYGFMQYFMVRAGYTIEGGMWKESTRTTWYTGPSAGVSIGIPLVKKERGNQKILLDYAYRFTNRWKGNHSIGIKLAL